MLRAPKQIGKLLDAFGIGRSAGRKTMLSWNISDHFREQIFHRQRDKGWTFGRSHGELAGALYRRRQDGFVVDAEAPFHRRLDQLGGTADVRKMAEPLPSWIGPFVFTETYRFTGKNNHRHLLAHRGAHAHRG